jgi:hypothetical protein
VAAARAGRGADRIGGAPLAVEQVDVPQHVGTGPRVAAAHTHDAVLAAPEEQQLVLLRHHDGGVLAVRQQACTQAQAVRHG